MNKSRLIKNVVRLALASEYTRTPIRRTDITQKALGTAAKQFKDIFAGAQEVLRDTFGMELVELPMRDAATRTNLTARRAAAAKITSDKAAASANGAGGGSGGAAPPSTAGANASSKQYVLTTLLPTTMREPEIMVPHGQRESAYTGLVTLVVCIVYLSGCVISQAALMRQLRRMNADEYAAVDKTEKVLGMMQRQNYLIRVKDNAGDETSYDYHLGPRAKVEIGEEGVLNMIRTVYGQHTPEDLENKVRMNMGVDLAGEGDEDALVVVPNGQGPSQPRRRGRRRAARDEDEDDLI